MANVQYFQSLPADFPKCQRPEIFRSNLFEGSRIKIQHVPHSDAKLFLQFPGFPTGMTDEERAAAVAR